MSSTRDYWELKAIENKNELETHVLSSFESTVLNEVLSTPGLGTAIPLPLFKHIEKSEMVTVWMVKTSSSLISQGSLLSWSVENILN